LLGKAASDFTLPAAEWKVVVPDVPAGVPSTLLQRRPDIAAAERRVAAANAQIGIARSAYFPSLNLTGSYGYAAASSAGLFNASNNLWSLGLSAAQTLFDAGATKARVAGPKPSVMPPLPVSPERAGGVCRCGEPAGRHPRAGAATGFAQGGIGCGRSGRSADAEPLSRRAGQLARW
jgi:hypothetical protein